MVSTCTHIQVHIHPVHLYTHIHTHTCTHVLTHTQVGVGDVCMFWGKNVNKGNQANWRMRPTSAPHPGAPLTHKTLQYLPGEPQQNVASLALGSWFPRDFSRPWSLHIFRMGCMFIYLPVTQLYLEPCLEMLGTDLAVSHSPCPGNCSEG